MGVRHLIEIRDFLKRKRSPVTETGIRDALQINRGTVKDCLAFLLAEGNVKNVGGRYVLRRVK